LLTVMAVIAFVGLVSALAVLATLRTAPVLIAPAVFLIASISHSWPPCRRCVCVCHRSGAAPPANLDSPARLGSGVARHRTGFNASVRFAPVRRRKRHGTRASTAIRRVRIAAVALRLAVVIALAAAAVLLAAVLAALPAVTALPIAALIAAALAVTAAVAAGSI